MSLPVRTLSRFWRPGPGYLNPGNNRSQWNVAARCEFECVNWKRPADSQHNAFRRGNKAAALLFGTGHPIIQARAIDLRVRGD
jgi:hypothetical protein